MNNMRNRENIALISATVFTVAAFVHLLRIVFKFDFSIGGESISLWVSVLGMLLAGYLAIVNFRLVERITRVTWLKFAALILIVDAFVTFYSYIEGLSYWGLSRTAFGWITIVDIILVGLISYYIKKSSTPVGMGR